MSTADDAPEPTHAMMASLLGAYVLGALEPGELRAVRAHLLQCSVCRAEVNPYERIVGLLPRRPTEQ